MFQHDEHNIKLYKTEVGLICHEVPFKIRLQVVKQDINEDGNPNCIWKWITLKKESKTLEEAKKFLNDNFVTITTKYKIHIEK
jgi:hypothetical protein